MLVSILIDIVIFNILYGTIKWGVNYWKNAILYAICLEIKLAILTGIASMSLFFIAFGMYFIIGLFLIWILEKVADSLNQVWFTIIGIIAQNIISLIINLFL